jgi:hypothetical protein
MFLLVMLLLLLRQQLLILKTQALDDSLLLCLMGRRLLQLGAQLREFCLSSLQRALSGLCTLHRLPMLPVEHRH